MRKIIIEPCPVGFKASREEFDLGDKIGNGKTPEEALEDLLFMEGDKMTDNKFPSPTGSPIASRKTDTVIMVRDADGEPMRALDAEMPETIYIELVKSEKLGGYMMKHFDTKKSFDSGTKYIRADKTPIVGGDVKEALLKDLDYVLDKHGVYNSGNSKDIYSRIERALQTPASDGVELLKNEIRRLKRLFHLAEECSEVIKVASKSARFGEEYYNPATGNTNAYELKQECADVSCLIDETVSDGDAEFIDMIQTKREKVKKWMTIEEECLAALKQSTAKDGV